MVAGSIAACKLSCTVVINGVCSRRLVAIRGITAGAVHATIELRMLLIQWVDDTVSLFPWVTINGFADDSTLEAAGSPKLVDQTVGGATRYLTKAVEDIGME